VAKRLLATPGASSESGSGSGLSPLTVAVARMGGGVVVLLGWVAVSGRAGVLAGLDTRQWGWALATGAILGLYVAVWYAALARAQAVDVTAVLVLGAVVTALLDATVKGTALAPHGLGLALITAGALLMAAVATVGAGRPARHPAAAG